MPAKGLGSDSPTSSGRDPAGTAKTFGDVFVARFRNPQGDHAGRLIEAAGLKGATEGGAMVSTKHANFIVNVGDAAASDVRALMTVCQDEVQKQFGVTLVPEVELVGEW